MTVGRKMGGEVPNERVYMPIRYTVAWTAVFVISTLSSMVGIGGGVLYVPILLLLGFPFRQVAEASLFTIALASLSATLTYRHTRKVDWKLALLIEPPTLVMAFIGGYFSHMISTTILKAVLVGVLLLSGYFLLRPARSFNHRARSGGQGVHQGLGDREYSIHLEALLPATTLAGLLAGMEGISGGVLKVPAMVLLGGVPVDIAAATSELMVTFTAVTGLLGHLLTNPLDLTLTLPLAVVASVGGQVGARLAARTSQGTLQRLLAGMLLLAAGQLLWKGLLHGG
jgi:hypothetical protein